MKSQYTQEELEKLHKTLYDILKETIRVCDILKIEYFVIGGTAIGVHFWNGIIPWDDDIDIGMTRENYERFLREAPKVLSADYFLAWYKSDPNTPFYFAKVRKNNTVFIEETCKNINMNHGIFVDIFPFDKVPDNRRLQKFHRKICNRLSECFAGKEVWTWAYFGKCEIEKPHKKGFLSCLCTRIVVTLLPKRIIYRLLCRVQSLFNNASVENYNIVMTSVDHIPCKDIETPQLLPFGSLTVRVPNNLVPYLQNHYGKNLCKIPPKDQQINHAPLKLQFG